MGNIKIKILLFLVDKKNFNIMKYQNLGQNIGGIYN